MPHHAAVPFKLKRSQDVISAGSVTSTTETTHGLLRLEGDRLVIQWRLSRQTEQVGGASYRSEEEVEAVREVELPLSALAGAHVRRRWWNLLFGPRIVLRAADLRAFDSVAGTEGLKLSHPAEIALRLRRSDVLVAEEFAAELAMSLAQRALEKDHRDELEQGRRDGLEKPAGTGKVLPPSDPA